MFLRTNPKFEPGAVKRNFCRSIWMVCTTCTISLLPDILKVTKTTTVEREYSKTKKNHQKLIIKRKRKAPYLAQYTKIGKVIKCFRTAAFTDLDQWQFVLKLSRHVFFYHPESVYKVGRGTDQDMFRYRVRKYMRPESRRKVDLWPFDPKFDVWLPLIIYSWNMK